ncbi:HGGxSTG domain-containing protein [Microvirga sp. BSC39]|uniref:HGGxSTG domain-containing protein n=1 Tax=Microvirga sp. BSC39 TaxID=1549810 RepID=UPI0009DF407B|nr:HGGxSTG domain-containing protein [Microvirga sp. BSC39]
MERNTREPESLRLTPRCGATTRAGTLCMRPRAKGKARCRLHGGAAGSGAPKGDRNGQYKHGRYTAEAVEERRAIAELLGREK